MSANANDIRIYGRTMADARRVRDERVAEALAPKCPNCSEPVDEMGMYCTRCKENGYGVEE